MRLTKLKMPQTPRAYCPLPCNKAEIEMSKPVAVEFIENFLVAWDSAKSSELYKMGYYGKPLGIPKPKMAEFNVPLILDLMEGLYLVEKGIIEVREGLKDMKNIKALPN